MAKSPPAAASRPNAAPHTPPLDASSAVAPERGRTGALTRLCAHYPCKRLTARESGLCHYHETGVMPGRPATLAGSGFNRFRVIDRPVQSPPPPIPEGRDGEPVREQRTKVAVSKGEALW